MKVWTINDSAYPTASYIVQDLIQLCVLCRARMLMDFLKADKPLDLANIRYALIRQEDTIIFKLIE